MNEHTILNTRAAAEYLHEQIPGDSVQYWRQALINNRRSDRTPPYRVGFKTVGRAAFYTPDELANFVEFEKGRRLGTMKLTGRAAEVMRAFGIGTASGSTTGRKLTVTAITPQTDEGTGKPFIQFITDDPLMVYRLELHEAKTIARELIDAIGACDGGQK